MILGVALAAVAITPTAPARAHEGSGAAYTGVAGPYQVVAYDGRAAFDANRVEYRILLTDADTKSPVDAATVAVTATLAFGDRHSEPTQQTARTANIYTFTLPRLPGATWRVTATVDGPQGHGSAQYFVHAGALAVPADARSDSGASGLRVLTIALGATAAAALIAVAIARRRRV